MDESFQFRARLRAWEQAPARLDYALLTAMLGARQAASASAEAQAKARRQQAMNGHAGPLSELLLSGPDWKQAAGAQQGCFNRAEARRRLHLS
jgi:hypothetical protein